MYLEKEAP